MNLAFARLSTGLTVFLALLLMHTPAHAKVVIQYLDDPTLSDVQVSVGDTVQLVISEDTDYRTRAARLGCHIWCTDNTLRAVGVSPLSKDGTATFTEVELDGDTAPPSDLIQVSFTENIADPDLWATGGPRDLAIIDFLAVDPGTFAATIQSLDAFDDAGNPLSIDFDSTDPLTVTVAPEPGVPCGFAFGALSLRVSGRRSRQGIALNCEREPS